MEAPWDGLEAPKGRVGASARIEARHITAELVRQAIATCSDRPSLVGAIDIRNAGPAAVVVPLTLADEPAGPSLTFVLRSAHLKDHAGEVGFPGGKPEPGDADLHATAAREMHEEIGVAPSDLTWLGRLTPCPVITGRYIINPFVAAVRPEATPRVISTGEIARILTLPLLPYLRGERPIHAVKATWHGGSVLAPHFELDGVILYGATAYITYELMARVAAALGAGMPPLVVQDAPPWGSRYRREEKG